MQKRAFPYYYRRVRGGAADGRRGTSRNPIAQRRNVEATSEIAHESESNHAARRQAIDACGGGGLLWQSRGQPQHIGGGGS